MRGFFITFQRNIVYRGFSAVLVCLLSFSLVLSPTASYAQSINIFNLPVSGAMVLLSPAFTPVLLKGMTVHTEDPLKFDFIIDSGNTDFTTDQVKEESERLVKYFLASMTVPKDDLWVNLSPYEEDRIIPEELGKTELGRDMLAQDYILKQLTASLMYPEEELGQKFWNRIYARAEEEFGTSEIPVNTFNKVWILPENATVYEHEQTVYVVDARLKVMLDSDYAAMQHENVGATRRVARTGDMMDDAGDLSVSSQIIKEIILPEIEYEVNHGANFAPLRQIYHSLILAKWYKETVKNSLLSRVYVDKNKIVGVDLADGTAKDKIYAQYMEAYKKGVFNYIKEDYDRLSDEMIPRKYFSGGLVIGAGEIHRTSSPVRESRNPKYHMKVGVSPTGNKKSMFAKLAAMPKTVVVTALISALTCSGGECSKNHEDFSEEKTPKSMVSTIKQESEEEIFKLIEMLDSRSNKRVLWTERKKAREELIKIGRPAVEPMIAFITNKGTDSFHASEIINILSVIKDPKVVPPIFNRLGFSDALSDSTRRDLAQFGESGVPFFIDKIKYYSMEGRSSWKEASNAARILSIMGGPAVPDLRELLKDEDVNVRERAQSVLDNIGMKPGDYVVDFRKYLRQKKDAGNNTGEIVSDLLHEIEESGQDISVDTLIGLMMIREEETIDNELIKHGNLIIRTLIRTIPYYGALHFDGPQKAYGKGPGNAKSDRIAKLLDSIADPRTISLLIHGKDSFMRYSSNTNLVISTLTNPMFYEDLERLLSIETARPYLVYAAVSSMKRIDEQNPGLTTDPVYLRQNDQIFKLIYIGLGEPFERGAEARLKLLEIGEPAVEPLLNLIKNSKGATSNVFNAVSVLSGLDAPEAIPVIYEAFKTGSLGNTFQNSGVSLSLARHSFYGFGTDAIVFLMEKAKSGEYTAFLILHENMRMRLHPEMMEFLNDKDFQASPYGPSILRDLGFQLSDNIVDAREYIRNEERKGADLKTSVSNFLKEMKQNGKGLGAHTGKTLISFSSDVSVRQVLVENREYIFDSIVRAIPYYYRMSFSPSLEGEDIRILLDSMGDPGTIDALVREYKRELNGEAQGISKIEEYAIIPKVIGLLRNKEFYNDLLRIKEEVTRYPVLKRSITTALSNMTGEEVRIDSSGQSSSPEGPASSPVLAQKSYESYFDAMMVAGFRRKFDGINSSGRFKSSVEMINGYKVLILTDKTSDSVFSVVPGFGFKIHSLRINGKDIYRPASDVVGSGGQVIMSPWVGRIENGEFIFDGALRDINDLESVKIDGSTGYPKDGLVRNQKWVLEDAGIDVDGVFVRASIDAANHPDILENFGHSKLTMTIHMNGQDVFYDVEQENLDNKRVYSAVGLHEYGTSINGSTTLELEAGSVLDADEKGIPTGLKISVNAAELDGHLDFNDGAIVVPGVVDRTYTDVAMDDQGRWKAVATDSARGIRRTYLADGNMFAHPHIWSGNTSSYADITSVEFLTDRPDGIHDPNARGWLEVDEKRAGRIRMHVETDVGVRKADTHDSMGAGAVYGKFGAASGTGTENFSSSPVTEDSDVGGINLNAIEVQRQGAASVDIQFDPVEVQQIIDMGIDGFAPVIINIIPLPSVLPLLGLAPQRDEEEEFEISRN